MQKTIKIQPEFKILHKFYFCANSATIRILSEGTRGGETLIPNQGLEGGGLAKGWKKIVTSPILMVEVVADGTSDGSARVHGVFELL